MEKCPRCEGDLALPGGSRVTLGRDIRICGDCCVDEAARDSGGLPPVPPEEWPVSELLAWS